MRAARIPRNTPVKAKQPDPRRSRSHLDFIRGLPCCACGRGPRSEAAHIRAGTDGGMGIKPSDQWTVPLCNRHHREQHDKGELTFWASRGVDPYGLAQTLWRHSGDQERGRSAVFKTVQSVEIRRNGECR